MISISFNDFISTRGLSGTSVGSGMIQNALRNNFKVNVVSTKMNSRYKLIRATKMIYWDLFGSVRGWKKRNDQIVIHASNTGTSRKNLKSILFLHDTMVLDFPQMFDPLYHLYVSKLCNYSVKRATVVITASNHSRARILHYWPEADVRVISWPNMRVINKQNIVPFSNRKNRVLVVASLDYHKRITLAIELVNELKSNGFEDLKLTIVGRHGNADSVVRDYANKIDPFKKWIQIEENVSIERLQDLYQTSKILVVPSIDEGFCLPATESVAFGTPVVHCDRGSLQEVAPILIHPEIDNRTDYEKLVFRTRAILSNQEIWENTLEIQRKNQEKFNYELFKYLWIQIVTDFTNIRASTINKD